MQECHYLNEEGAIMMGGLKMRTEKDDTQQQVADLVEMRPLYVLINHMKVMRKTRKFKYKIYIRKTFQK